MSLTIRVTGSVPQQIDEAMVRHALKLLVDPESIVQVFGIPGFQHGNRRGNDLDGLIGAVRRLIHADGIYLVLNPLTSRLTITEGVIGGKRITTGDVAYRRWLFLDIDPIKPAEHKDNPATDEEHELARQAAEEIRDYLAEQGWPAPIMIDSGNGWYLLYRTELPNSQLCQMMIRRWTQGLAERVKAKAKIDKSVHDAPRLAKLPGTWNRKGKQSDDRPWRMCKVVFVPEVVEVVTAVMVQETTPKQEDNGHAPKKSRFTLKVGTCGASAYAAKALDNECARVAGAAAGTRNDTLNKAAFALGTLVGGGYLDRPSVERRLRDVAQQCGLHEDKGGERGIEATIRSGLDAGILEPRIVMTDKPPLASEGSGPKAEPGETLTIGAHEITPENVNWLWFGRLPRGKPVTWAGQTGLGKSFLTCDIAALLSVGGEIPFGGGECFPKAGTLMINCEDGYADTIVPRLIEAAADLNMVRFLKMESMAVWTLLHLDALEKAIREVPDCGLVVIDPAPSFLGGVDDHKNSEFRSQILMPFSIRLQAWNVSSVFVTHFNKAGSHKVEVIDRVMGGVSWVSGVRLAAAFIKSPTPEHERRRLYVPLKSNLCSEQPALAYQLVNVDGDRNRCRVEWLEQIDTTAEQAMADALQGTRQPRSVIAAEWLIEQFNIKREWASEDLFKAAEHSCVSRNAVFEAKKTLNLPRCRRVASENGDVQFVWWVPDDWPHLRRNETL